MLATITSEPEICRDERDPESVAIFMEMRVNHQPTDAVYLLHLSEEGMPNFQKGQIIEAHGSTTAVEHRQHLTMSAYALPQ